jgi:hypothetical protein
VPGQVCHAIRLAVAAAQQIGEDFSREVGDIVLPGLRVERVGSPGVTQGNLRRDRQPACRRYDSGAGVIEGVNVRTCVKRRIESEFLVAQQIASTRGVDPE